MGSPQGHRETWDETGVETKNVRLPQRLCREDHHSEDSTSKDNQQVCLDQTRWSDLTILGLDCFFYLCQWRYTSVMFCFCTFKPRFCQRTAVQWCAVSLYICRFHAFLLFLGHPVYAVREVSIHRFSKILSEFALEYRTTRERVLQQKQKRANHRERNKTRGKMITDVSALHHEQRVTRNTFSISWSSSLFGLYLWTIWAIPRLWLYL